MNSDLPGYDTVGTNSSLKEYIQMGFMIEDTLQFSFPL